MPALSTEIAPINWRSFEAMTDDRKDGRDVLLWVEDHAAICSWCGTCWCDSVGNEVSGATLFADVDGPATP